MITDVENNEESFRTITLPKGGTLELQVTPEFYDRIRKQFDIPFGSTINDDHVRMFVFGAFKTAIDKVG